MASTPSTPTRSSRPSRLDPVSRVTLAQLRSHTGRLAASSLAVVIAVAFVVATLALNASSKAAVLQAVGAPYVAADLVVQSQGYDATTGAELTVLPEAVAAVAAIDGVAQVAADRSTSVETRLPDQVGRGWTDVTALAPEGPLRWERVSAGRLPTTTGEVAVSARLGARVGDTVEVITYPVVDTAADPTADPDPEPVVSRATVVGVVDLRGDPSSGVSGRLFATEAQTEQWGATAVDQLRVALTPGADATAVRDALTGLVRADPTATVLTGTAAAEQEAAVWTGDAAELTAVLLMFAGISVLVAGLVIANTFAVLLAQRTRDLALLRTVGASRGQVARGVLVEAAVCGALASLVGAALGVGLAALVSTVVGSMDSPIPLGVVVVPPAAVLVGIAVGTTVTVLSALLPARNATRIAPLAALRPQLVALGARPNRVRAVLGWLVFLPSFAGMAYLSAQHVFLPAVAAGAVSFLGFLLLAQGLVPAVVALLGRLLAPLGGVPGRLAAGNALRNPRRTAATATALLIGVTLTTAMVVGAQSTRATATSSLEAGYPTDVVVSAGEAIDSSVQQRISGVEGVSELTAVQVLDLADGTRVLGLDPAGAAGVVRSQDRSPLPRPGEVVVGGGEAEARGLGDGDELLVDGRDSGLRVRVAPESELGMTATSTDVSALATASGTTAPIGQLWVRLADDLSSTAQGEAVDAITAVATEALPSSDVAGVVAMRAGLDRIVTTMLLVVTGLLAVAVLIALIGVGNTLALSVVERRQESGLLRALGLTRRQLRRLLAWEAALVAGVAGLLGVLLGTGYGLAGTTSVLGSTGPVVVDVPWLQVVAIIAVSALAGVLASVLPARRAARTPPVAAIAD